MNDNEKNDNEKNDNEKNDNEKNDNEKNDNRNYFILSFEITPQINVNLFWSSF